MASNRTEKSINQPLTQLPVSCMGQETSCKLGLMGPSSYQVLEELVAKAISITTKALKKQGTKRFTRTTSAVASTLKRKRE